MEMPGSSPNYTGKPNAPHTQHAHTGGAQSAAASQQPHPSQQGGMAHGGPGHSGMNMGAHSGQAGHGGHMMQDMRRRFFVCLLLAVPVLLLSPMMGLSLPFQLSFPGSDYLVLALATALFLYGGKPFLQGAVAELRGKKPAMMTLISLGITVAYGYSLYAFVNNHLLRRAHVMDFFWELATLIVIMLLGHWVEMRAVGAAGDAMQKMAKLLPGEVNLVESDGQITRLPLRQLQKGQRVLVRPGDTIPADGTVTEGSSSVNEALVTGEAKAVHKQPGSKVIGGSLNGDGSLTTQVEATGENGYLAQVMQLVNSAQQDKSRAATLADRVAGWLFYAAVGAGVLTLVLWLATGQGLAVALARTVTVLVIACPHALGLAAPLVQARSVSLGAKNGLLVRSRQALENAPKTNLVAMDKTGTLTEGQFKVTQLSSFDSAFSEEDVLHGMAALEQNASHPLALGILQAAKSKGLAAKAATEVQNLPGAGLQGHLEGRQLLLASPGYLDSQGIHYPKEEVKGQMEQGRSVSLLVVNGKAAGMVAQGDSLKPGAKQVIADLKRQGIRPVMLTGDNAAVAKTVAQQLAIEEYHAALLPQDKERQIQSYRGEGRTVMMVGDGINDAPSLARANVGVAIGAGTDIAISSADIILVKNNLADILKLLALGKNTNRKMKQNLFWGAGYNIVAIPLAAGVLAPLGLLLSPAAGAVLMSLSTIIVAINALTLRI